MARILGEIEQGSAAQLLLNHERLLEQLETAGQKFVLDFQEVTLADVHLERFVNDGEPDVVLDVLPTAVPVRNDACQQPVVMPAMPDFVLPTRHGRLLLVDPERVQLGEATVRDVKHEGTLVYLQIFLHRFRFLHFIVIVLHKHNVIVIIVDRSCGGGGRRGSRGRGRFRFWFLFLYRWQRATIFHKLHLIVIILILGLLLGCGCRCFLQHSWQLHRQLPVSCPRTFLFPYHPFPSSVQLQHRLLPSHSSDRSLPHWTFSHPSSRPPHPSVQPSL
uniref:Uncharacterized protein n=1 Tax=Anopheles christyi TaxID=43041 RepID=A0A182KI78_9DIPT